MRISDWSSDVCSSDLPDFALNRPENAGAAILVAGHNFGCGSSREHAPWALRDFGLRAVVSSQIADIFRSNALKNGLLPIVLDEPLVDELMTHPGPEPDIDVAARSVLLHDGRRYPSPLDPFAQACLPKGPHSHDYLQPQHAQTT